MCPTLFYQVQFRVPVKLQSLKIMGSAEDGTSTDKEERSTYVSKGHVFLDVSHISSVMEM